MMSQRDSEEEQRVNERLGRTRHAGVPEPRGVVRYTNATVRAKVLEGAVQELLSDLAHAKGFDMRYDSASETEAHSVVFTNRTNGFGTKLQEAGGPGLLRMAIDWLKFRDTDALLKLRMAFPETSPVSLPEQEAERMASIRAAQAAAVGIPTFTDATGRSCRSDGRSCFAFVMKREDAIRLLGELTAWLDSGQGNFVCSPMIRDSAGGTFEMWTSGIPAEARVSGKFLLLFEASGVAGDREDWWYPSDRGSLWGDCPSDEKSVIDPEKFYDLTNMSAPDASGGGTLWSAFEAWLLSRATPAAWGGSQLPALTQAVDTEAAAVSWLKSWWTRWTL